MNRFVAGIDGLDEDRLLKGNVVRDADQPGRLDAVADDPVHHADVLREASAGGLAETSGGADVLVELALCEGALAAVEALATGEVMEGHYAVADDEAAHAFADDRDGARHLMPIDAGSGVRTGVNLLEVGAADAAGVDPNQHFAAADFGYGDRLGPDIVWSVIDSSLHGARKVLVHELH
jgi:hypothetical protein